MFTTCCCLTAVIPLSSNPSNHRTWRLLVHRNTELTLDKNLTEPHLTSKTPELLIQDTDTWWWWRDDHRYWGSANQCVRRADRMWPWLHFEGLWCKKKRDDDSLIDCLRHFIKQKCPKLAGWSLLNIKISSFSCVHLTINQLTLEIIRSWPKLTIDR